MNSPVPTKVYEIVKKAVTGNIDNYEISVEESNKKGEGYLGRMFFISLQDKSNGKLVKLAVKQAFSEQNIRDFSPIREAFLNEIHFYTEVWPKFKKFQERVPTKYHFHHIAQCLATVSEDNFEQLVFENLKHQGFEMHIKKEPLQIEKFETIFKLYGRFHAISFAYKALNPEGFSELSEGLHDIFEKFLEKQSSRDYNGYIHEQSLNNLQPGIDDAVIEKYRHYIDDGMELVENSLVSGKYSVIVHGDCWSNNMMFKYDDSGELIDIRFLDFQLAKLGSPICDLSYCLYSGGTKATFDDLDHLLQIYHDSLSECLRAYGCDPDELYPFKALKSDWKVFGQYGLNSGLSLWRIKLVHDEEILDFTDVTTEDEGILEIFKQNNFDEETYKQRTRDIVVHFYENDFLF